MSEYRRDPAELLTAPRVLFDELSAKYGGLEAHQKIYRSGGSPSREEIVRPLEAFGKCDANTPHETYRVALRWCSAYPLDSGNSGTSRLELLPRMPLSWAELDTFDFGQIKPMLTLYAIKRSHDGHDHGKRFYLERFAKFPLEGFSFYAHGHRLPLVIEMLEQFEKLTSGFSFHLHLDTQEA